MGMGSQAGSQGKGGVAVAEPAEEPMPCRLRGAGGQGTGLSPSNFKRRLPPSAPLALSLRDSSRCRCLASR
jgi:hypothetical protein